MDCRLTLVATLVASLVSGVAHAADAEAPPPECRTGVVSSTRLFVSDPNTACLSLLGRPTGERHYQGCYVPFANLAILPRDCDESHGRIGSSCRVLVDHEDCHAQGYVHVENGRGWVLKPQ